MIGDNDNIYWAEFEFGDIATEESFEKVVQMGMLLIVFF